MIALIDYGAGNVSSVQNALKRLGQKTALTRDPGQIRRADRVIFPGVGQAAFAMTQLKTHGLDTLMASLQQPVLGICLGLQLMCRHTQEGDVSGLGIFDTDVRAFPPTGIVPHMGWNELRQMRGPLFAGIPERTDFYFVHSYAAEIGAETAAVNDYLTPFSAALQRDNFFAVQFHPEKSGATGAQLLTNFLRL